MPTAPQPSATYLPQLDGLRALAVLMVFLYHAFLIPLLWSGVDLFFILSGYLITGILLRDRDSLPFLPLLRRFYLRRAERILPAYLVFLTLAWLTLHIDFHRTWAYYAFFLQNVPYALGIAPAFALVPLWSLAVEQHFYLLWPAFIVFLPRRWLIRAMLALLLLEPLVRALCTPLFATPDPIYCLTPFRLDALAAGALAALLLPHCNATRTASAAKWTFLAAGTVLLALSIHPWFRRGDNTAIVNGLLYSLNILTLGGLFVLTVLSRNTLLARLLSSSPARGLGRISYMFYLLHVLILTLTNHYLSAWLPRISGTYSSAAIAFAATCLLATASWFCIERPILSLSASHRGT